MTQIFKYIFSVAMVTKHRRQVLENTIKAGGVVGKATWEVWGLEIGLLNISRFVLVRQICPIKPTNCGFFHKSMKFGILIDNGLSNIFSYGGIARNVSISFESIFKF